MSWWTKLLSLFKKDVPRETKEESVSVVNQPWALDLHPLFAKKIWRLVKQARAQGLKVDVFHGYRSWAEQEGLYAKGRTVPGNIVTNARGGYSWHNFGLACDVVFKDFRGRWSWSSAHDWAKLGEIGKGLGLEWGGDWTRIKDKPHFQMPAGIRLVDARREYRRGKLYAVWKLVNRRLYGKT